MGRLKFHSLKRCKLRQSMNKYNLYNLSKAKPQMTASRTFFQQKWTAKAMTRAYHGDTVREKHWNHMFRRTVKAVVPMDPDYLAQQDGSEQAAGRGSGVQPAPGTKQRRLPSTPYLNMVYAPLERRLDTAIFRALFASSTRQARQMVIHGTVKVNGKRMIYPGYQLNPGDMFQVETDRVMFALGAPKDTTERKAGRRARKNAEKSKEARQKASERENEEQVAQSDDKDSVSKSDTAGKEVPSDDAAAARKQKKKDLQALLAEARAILDSNKTDMSAARKRSLREFQRILRKSISRPDNFSTDDLDAQLDEIAGNLSVDDESESPTVSLAESKEKDKKENKNSSDLVMSSRKLTEEVKMLTSHQLSVLRKALIEARENPIDHLKPYATPWRPRDYMSAFAFIPRYLEVNQKVCAAVYLRHPVARPGLAEVPTPFALETNSLAHNWYLRRR